MSSRQPSVPGLESRRATLRILDRVLRSGSTVDGASYLATSLPPSDQALAFAIVGETVRRLPELDALIDGAMRQPLPADSKARMVLRLALAQKLTMTVPDHAIVSTALPLVDGGPRRLVHGVLGTLIRSHPQPSASTPLPAEVEARWADHWGDAAVASARRQIVSRPALDLSFVRDEDAKAFAAANDARSLAPRHVRLESGNVSALPGYDEGDWWVQDLAASLPARLIPAGRPVLDLCAAPGGKTMQLAAAGNPVVALDSSKGRLARLGDNLRRTRLEARLVRADAFDWGPDGPIDAILLDAPCSATGTFRRHPEVLYRVRPRYIAEAAETQLRLLTRASAWLRPGGTLIYSVCSLEREEGEGVIEAFLASNPGFGLIPPAPGELPEFVPVSKKGWVRILPGTIEEEGGLDGFFIARLVRDAK